MNERLTGGREQREHGRRHADVHRTPFFRSLKTGRDGLFLLDGDSDLGTLGGLALAIIQYSSQIHSVKSFHVRPDILQVGGI